MKWLLLILLTSCSSLTYVKYDKDGKGDVKTRSGTQFALAQGKVEMTGTDYETWDDSNSGAYLYVANVLNLTITGDYVPPISDEQPA